MSLNIGNIGATSGMAQAIYDQIRSNLEPDLGDMPAADLEKVRASWRKLAHGIATGVVNHLRANLEIRNIQTQGDVDVTVGGATAEASGHQHAAGTLSGSQSNVIFNQINEGTGLID